MIRDLDKAKEYIGCFKIFKIQNIPPNKNQKADVLTKLASVAFNHLTNEILVETLDVPSMDVEEINTIVEEEGKTWMTPIINCLEKGIWPKDQNEAHALRMKISQYVMEERHAFKGKVGSSKGHPTRILLANNAPRRKRRNMQVRLMPDPLPNLQVAQNTDDLNHGPLTILPMGNGCARTIARSSRKNKILNYQLSTDLICLYQKLFAFGLLVGKKSLKKKWMKSVSMKQRLAGNKSLKKKWMQKESVSNQGRKPAKSEPTVHKDPAFDDLDDVDVNDAMDYIETDAYMQKGVSTEDQVSTIKPDEGTDKPKVSTYKPEVSTAKPKEVEVSTDKLNEGTVEPKDGTSNESTAPTTVFRDDETIAEFLVSMSQNKAKQKGVEIKDAEDSDRPRATSTRSVLTLKPLPKIDPKDKGKKVLEEEAESDDESEGVDEAKRKFDQLAKDKEIARKARIKADRLLAVRLQEEDRETFIVKERAKFLYDTIATQRRSNRDFIAIGLAKDERQIKELNEESKDPKKKRVVNETLREEDTTKVPAEQEVTNTLDSEIMETKSFVSKLHKVSSPDGDYLVVYRVNGHFRAFNYLMEIMMESSTEENDQGIVAKMLDLGLEVKEESTAALHLIWLVQKQTAFGKDKSNPLIVYSLLKTIRLSIHLVVYNEELAIPEQTATGKGISNPLMAGSLPKTTKPT
ncbi:hypothetical protein Tco_0789561 [Tanacetum coccineum]